MTPREHDPMNTHSDERFDQAMRELHAQSLSRVSSPTRARLRVARQAAARPATQREPHRGFTWVLGSGLAAVFAVAIGLQLRPAQAPVVPSTSAVASTTNATAYDADTAVAALDENPDLYLWLASNDDAVPSLEP